MSSSRAKNSQGPAEPPLGNPRAQAGEPLALEDLARLRQGVYRFLGAAFLYPDADWAAAYPPIADELAGETRPLAALAFWGEWEALLEAMGRVSEADRAALGEIYTEDFLMNDPWKMCSPYESAYVNREGVADLMAELDEIYSGDGFSLAPSLHQTPDHAAVELEYLSLLCGREAGAWERGDPEEGVKYLRRQKSFIEAHLARWFPAFAGGIQRRRGEGLYSAAAGAVLAFVSHELDLIASLLGRYEEKIPS